MDVRHPKTVRTTALASIVRMSLWPTALRHEPASFRGPACESSRALEIVDLAVRCELDLSIRAAASAEAATETQLSCGG